MSMGNKDLTAEKQKRVKVFFIPYNNVATQHSTKFFAHIDLYKSLIGLTCLRIINL